MGIAVLSATTPLNPRTIEAHRLSVLSQNLLRLHRHAQAICPSTSVVRALSRVRSTEEISVAALGSQRLQVIEQMNSLRNLSASPCVSHNLRHIVESFRSAENIVPASAYDLARYGCRFQVTQQRISHCQAWFLRAVQALRPRCSKVNKPGLNNYLDSLPCHAGDEMSAKILLRQDPNLVGSHRFMLAIWNASQTSRAVELFPYFLKEMNLIDNHQSRLFYLAWLAFGTAGTTSMAGHLEGWSLEFVFGGLLSGMPAEDVLNRYLLQKDIKDSFSFFLSEAKRAHVRLQFFVPLQSQGNGFGSDELNRHDFMGAFLTCHLLGEGLAEYLPVALGYAYESLDMVTHLTQEKWSLRQSVTNWKVDVSRYHRARAIGLEFCAGQEALRSR